MIVLNDQSSCDDNQPEALVLVMVDIPVRLLPQLHQATRQEKDHDNKME